MGVTPSASAQLAAAVAAGLREAGARRIFGMPGGGPNLDLIGAAQAQGIDFVLAHGETAACIMASSYGRLTGTPGVAVVTRGPGLTSAANGLAQATLDRFPLLLLSDSVWQGDRDRVAHQRLDQVAAAAPLAKWSGVLGTADPAAAVAAAARLSLAAPEGGVQLALDPTVPGDLPPGPAPGPGAGAASVREAVARARQVLAAGRRPVVLVGLDARRHVGPVRAALTTLDCPVLVSYEAKGVIPESWPTYAGLFTGAVIERAVLDRADVVLAIGLDPVEPMPGRWPQRLPVVLFGGHPIETGYFGDPVRVVGSYRDDLADLVDACRSGWEPGAGRSAHQRALAALDPDPDPDAHPDGEGLHPQHVVQAVRERFPGAVVTVDAGAHMLVAMPLWSTDDPDRVLISNGLATMGYALPAAIGAAFATRDTGRPASRVVCLVGDGGLGMVLAELETLARCRLDVTVVVFDDATLSLIKLKQGAGQGGEPAVGYRPVDFAAVASAMGVPSASARDRPGLALALADAAPLGPFLVDARIDPRSYPHVLQAIRG